MDALRRYAVPVVMALVATWQIVRVHTQGLSSWRGGGFGMYARFHPRTNDLWLCHGDDCYRYTKYDGRADEFTPHLRRCLTLTNEKTLRQALSWLPCSEEHTHSLSVYRLDFDPVKMTLSRKVLARVVEGE